MLQTIAQIGSLPALLLGLLALAAVVLVGRLVLKVAWKLVMIALLVVAVFWVLGMLGLPLGIL